MPVLEESVCMECWFPTEKLISAICMHHSAFCNSEQEVHSDFLNSALTFLRCFTIQ